MVDKNFIDLFCGAGGFSTGFSENNFKPLFATDNRQVCTRTFTENHPDATAVCKDVRKVDRKFIKSQIGHDDIDVIVGGPPCQGFSMAGNRIRTDPRNKLVYQYLRLVDEIRPAMFVMENVRGIASMKSGSGLFINRVLRKVEKLGYHTKSKILMAADFGVPQKRQRFFLVGYQDGIDFEFPEETHSQTGLHKKTGGRMEKWVAVKHSLDPIAKVEQRLFYSQRLIDGFERREKLNRERGLGFRWRFLDPDQPSYTISARYYKDGAEALVKYSDRRIRRLSPEECARIQTFPENYVFTGSRSEIYNQIGNAVPPGMSEIIGKSVENALK